ncbi:hypothetical protein [Kutzneria albida]|nr:hypothetical protein [Kutzneria albida]
MAVVGGFGALGATLFAGGLLLALGGGVLLVVRAQRRPPTAWIQPPA